MIGDNVINERKNMEMIRMNDETLTKMYDRTHELYIDWISQMMVKLSLSLTHTHTQTLFSHAYKIILLKPQY